MSNTVLNTPCTIGAYILQEELVRNCVWGGWGVDRNRHGYRNIKSDSKRMQRSRTTRGVTSTKHQSGLKALLGEGEKPIQI